GHTANPESTVHIPERDQAWRAAGPGFITTHCRDPWTPCLLAHSQLHDSKASSCKGSGGSWRAPRLRPLPQEENDSEK
ncbi:hypothetical protein P7K49_019171, partial [Saguinus oedipus]